MEVCVDHSVLMLKDTSENESPDQFRERRRRRTELRRLAGIRGCSSVDVEGGGAGPSSSFPVEREPVFGAVSICGRNRQMEDRVDVTTNLCRPEICERKAVHFFAVFDGHGGPHVSMLCKERMHMCVAEELMRMKLTDDSIEGASSTQEQGGAFKTQEQWRTALKKSFKRIDDLAITACGTCGKLGYNCGCWPMEMATFMGSTAVVVLLTLELIVVANCGDSRAVLCRSGRAISLSIDHKPDRADELERIEGCGGKVTYEDRARVQGMLSMSRAIGDRLLKPMVISEPEISFTRRDPEDDFIILASDGLWDVISNDGACEMASGCFTRGATESSRTDEAARTPSIDVANLLTRLALGRGSRDNISVVVVDLRRS